MPDRSTAMPAVSVVEKHIFRRNTRCNCWTRDPTKNLSPFAPGAVQDGEAVQGGEAVHDGEADPGGGMIHLCLLSGEITPHSATHLRTSAVLNCKVGSALLI